MGAEALPAALEAERPVRQIGQWSLVWYRLRSQWPAWLAFLFLCAMLGLALVGPLVAPGLLASPTLSDLNQAPGLHLGSWVDIMGTDSHGDPIAAYVLGGARATLAIGVLGSLLSIVIGALIGGVAAYVGRVVDAVLMRITDLLLAVPVLLLLVLISLYFTERTLWLYVALFGLTGWAGPARLVRSYVLSLREREFADAARALGASDPAIIMRHMLPNVLDILIVAATLNVAIFILTEATLEFLVLGPDAITWGHELALAYYSGALSAGYWWQFAFPGVPLLLTMLAINVVGDGLRDALDASGVSAPSPARYQHPRYKPLAPVGRLVRGVIVRVTGVIVAARDVAYRPYTVAGRQRTIDPWTAAGRRMEHWPWPGRLVPVVVIAVAAAIPTLAANARLQYAPNYSVPSAYVTIADSVDVAGSARADGWNLLSVEGHGNVVYRQIRTSGGVTRSHVLARHDGSASELSVGGSQNRVICAWVDNQGQTLRMVLVTRHVDVYGSFTIPGGIVENPYVLAGPHGQIDMLFSEQRPGRNQYDVYLAQFDGRNRRFPRAKMLIGAADYAFLPRGVFDGSGALDVVDFERRQPGQWAIRFARFTSNGEPLGPHQTIGMVSYAARTANNFVAVNVPLPPWGLDLKRAGDGSVWAAWEGDASLIQDAGGGVEGTTALSIAHWSRGGTPLLQPTVIDPEPSTGQHSLSLGLQSSGGQVFYAYSGAYVMRRLGSNGVLEIVPGLSGHEGTYLVSLGFDSSGTPTNYERVNYEGDDVATVAAGSASGEPRALWQRSTTTRATIESARYHSGQPPDLLTRLGLNIGSLWANLGFLVVGSLVAATFYTLSNVGLVLALLFAFWLFSHWVPAGWRLGMHGLLVTVVFLYVFVLQPSPPPFVLSITALGAFTGWIAILSGLALGLWTDLCFFRRLDAVFRAAMLVIVPLYCVAFVYAITIVQAEIGRI